MAYVGGLRDRLVVENVRNLIEECLSDLGWFSSNSLINNPLEIRTEPVDDDTEILPNVITIVDEDVDSMEQEMGSDFREHRWSYAIDIFAEDTASGKHLAGDVRAILQGKLPSIGRVGDRVAVYDLTQATPDVMFYIEIEDVVSGRQRYYTKPFQKFWWTVLFDVVDYYDNEDDD